MNANYDRRKVRTSHGDDTLMAQVRPELESRHSSTRPKVPTPTSERTCAKGESRRK